MPEQSNNPLTFWQELKRRKVVRVITVYAAAAFVIIEVVNNISEPLNLPEWISRWVIIMLGIGLFVAIILSWIFDITPEGIEKTKSIDEVQIAETPSASKIWKIATYTSLIVIIGLVTLNIINRFKYENEFSKFEKSIAVLPFKNFSADPDQEYMCDGLTDEIINHLFKIESFDRVVPLITTMVYKETDKNVRQIAKELNVNFLLGGTYKKIGEELKVTTQLIEAKKDRNIWQHEYNQPYKEIMSIQTDIALRIAKELKTKLSQEETKRIEYTSTNNTEALKHYLIGNQLQGQANENATLKAIDHYQEAIKLDSNFARAYAGLGYSYYFLYGWGDRG